MKKVVVTISVILSLILVCSALGEDAIYVTKKDYPMAHTAEDLDLFHQSMLNDNVALWMKLRQEGRGWMSKAGLEVYIVEKEDSGKIKIRPKNSSSEIWTLPGAVKRK